MTIEESNKLLSAKCTELKCEVTSLKEEVAILKEIIKENFGYNPINLVQIYFKYDGPVMEKEIKKVLTNG